MMVTRAPRATASVIPLAKDSEPSPARQLVTSTVFVYGLGAVVVGLALLWWSGADTWHKFAAELGNLLVVTALLGSLWELRGRRRFAREILEKVGLGADVGVAGLSHVGMNYLAIPWSERLAGVNQLDVVAGWANTWRNNNLGRIREIAARPGSRIRVFLPDPDEEAGVGVLADRFASTPAQVRANIETARREWEQLRQAGGGAIEIRYRSADLPWALYRMDRVAVFTLYSSSRERGDVPVFAAEEPGSLYAFAMEQLDALASQGRPV